MKRLSVVLALTMMVSANMFASSSGLPADVPMAMLVRFISQPFAFLMVLIGIVGIFGDYLGHQHQFTGLGKSAGVVTVGGAFCALAVPTLASLFGVTASVI